jgi:hypothetical protein
MELRFEMGEVKPGEEVKLHQSLSSPRIHPLVPCCVVGGSYIIKQTCVPLL